MKKIITCLALVSAFLMATPARAQFNYGIEAGINLNNARTSGALLDAENRTGWFVGAKAKITLPIIGLGLDGAIHYAQKDVKVGSNETGETKTLPSVNIPVNLRYGIGLGSIANVFLATGPEWDFNLGSKSIGDTFDLKSSIFSWNVGVGATLFSHLEVGLVYNIGIGNTGEVNSEAIKQAIGQEVSGSLKNNSFSIKAAYYF